MYTKAALLDILKLTHQGTDILLRHCSGLSTEQINQTVTGFGYSTLQRQLHHIFEAEQYWVDVLADRYKDSDLYSATADDAWKAYPTVADIQEYGKDVAAATVAYLDVSANEALNEPQEFLTWPADKRKLIPARVILRITTHAFHHRGQAVAMCRLLGHPTPSMDFPVAPD